MSGPAASNAKVSVGIILNLASAIGIVFINKFIYVHYEFPSMTLTLIHFTVTSLGLQICAWMDVFSPKRLMIKKTLPLATSFCGFVVFTNLSLQNNTVGTYQLAKALTTPVILFIQAVFYSKSVSLSVKLTVVSLCPHFNIVCVPINLYDV
jgi:solute carrier family 35 protein E3